MKTLERLHNAKAKFEEYQDFYNNGLVSKAEFEKVKRDFAAERSAEMGR